MVLEARRGKKLATVYRTLACATALVSFSFEAAAQGSCSHGTTTLTFDHPAGVAQPFYLDVSVNGGANHGVLVDTGSTGLVLPKDVIGAPLVPYPALPPPAPPSCIYYDSSGTSEVGHWYRASVTLQAKTPLKTGEMPVLGVTLRCTANKTASASPTPAATAEAQNLCPTVKATDICEPVTAQSKVGMIGIGFDRGGLGGTGTMAPQYDVVRQIAAANPSFSPGYILKQNSLQIGLDDGPDMNQFSWTPLTPASNSGAAPWQTWQTTPGCFQVTASGETNPPRCGTILLDTGITEMFVDSPRADWPSGNNGDRSPSGSTIQIAVPSLTQTPKPALTYTVPGVPTANTPPPAPTSIMWIDNKANSNFVNTGRRLLSITNYAYDAQCGRVGFEQYQGRY